jgi:8-oxo-dGTP diphosphatase
MRGTTNIPEVSVIIRDGKKILFVLRRKTGYADGMYALPGGHVEPQENFIDAAVREVMEEVNVQTQRARLRAVLTSQRFHPPDDVRVGIFFEAAAWTGEPKSMETDRMGPIAWFDGSDLPYHKIMDFHAEGLKAITRGDIYMELGWDSLAK